MITCNYIQQNYSLENPKLIKYINCFIINLYVNLPCNRHLSKVLCIMMLTADVATEAYYIDMDRFWHAVLSAITYYSWW